MNENQDLEEEWTLDFHGNNYIIDLIVNDYMLTLELEDTKNSQRWSKEFTAQSVEEMTQKAGNFKKFSVYIQMLVSAFNKDSESVYADIVTIQDLEQMKTRVNNENASTNASMNQSRQSTSLHGRSKDTKRYVILTYASQYDRVHYPLPLLLEETPNVPAMQRTIRRLRQQVEELRDGKVQEEFTSEKERELRQSIATFRQENQELRHRLRQAESRAGKSTTNSTAGAMNTSVQYDSRDDVVHGKTTVHGTAGGVRSSTVVQRAHQSQSKQQQPNMSDVLRELNEVKKRLIQSEREVRVLKLTKGQASTASAHTRHQSPYGQTRRSSTPTSSAATGGRPLSSGGWSQSSRNSGDSTTRRSTLSTRDPSPRGSFGSGRTPSRSHSHTAERQRTPTPPPRRKGGSSSGYGQQPPSPSGPGRRFDPTSYQRDKDRRQLELQQTKAWGAPAAGTTAADSRSGSRSRGGSGHRYYREDGYDSSHSKSSTGSRASRQSTFSNRSNNSHQHSQRNSTRDANYARNTKSRTSRGRGDGYHSDSTAGSRNIGRSVGSKGSQKSGGQKKSTVKGRSDSTSKQKGGQFYIGHSSGVDTDDEYHSRAQSSGKGRGTTTSSSAAARKRQAQAGEELSSNTRRASTRSSTAGTARPSASSITDSILNSPSRGPQQPLGRSSTRNTKGHMQPTASTAHSAVDRSAEFEQRIGSPLPQQQSQESAALDRMSSPGRTAKSSSSGLPPKSPVHPARASVERGGVVPGAFPQTIDSRPSNNNNEHQPLRGKSISLLASSLDSEASSGSITASLLAAAEHEKQAKLNRINKKMNTLTNSPARNNSKKSTSGCAATDGSGSGSGSIRDSAGSSSGVLRASFEKTQQHANIGSVEVRKSSSGRSYGELRTYNDISRDEDDDEYEGLVGGNDKTDHHQLPSSIMDTSDISKRLSSLSSYLESARGSIVNTTNK